MSRPSVRVEDTLARRSPAPQEEARSRTTALIALFASLSVIAGGFYAISAFIKPMQADLGWSRSELSAATALNLMVFAFAQPLMGRVIDRWGPARVMFIASGGLGATFWALSLATSLLHLYVLFGLLAPIAFSGCNLVPAGALVARWSPRGGGGMASGLISAAIPAGQSVILPVVAMVIAATGWRQGFTALALTIWLIALPLLGWIVAQGQRPPEAAHLREPHARERPTALWRSRPFLLLFGGFLGCGFADTMVGVHLIPFIADAGPSNTVGAIVASALAAAAIVGTVAIGSVTDSLGDRRPLAALYAARALTFLLLIAFAWTAWLPLVAVFALTFGLTFIATFPPTVGIARTSYGSGALGSVIGGLWLAHQLGGAAGAFGAGLIYDRTGSYVPAFVLAMIASAAAAVASNAIRVAARPEA